MIARLFLAANLVVFWVFAVGCLIAPRALAAALDIALGSPTAVADFRAVYGGLCLGIGAILLRGMRSPAWLVPGIWLAILSAGGLALGRIVTIVVDGMPGPIIFGFLLSELISVAVGGWILSRLGHAPGAHAAALPPLSFRPGVETSR